MTIAAGLLAADGVVLASDSTVTVSAPDGKIISLFTGAQKIYQLGRSRPYGFVLFGNASFGMRSFRDLFAEFDATLDKTDPPVAVVAKLFHDFADAKWKEEAAIIGNDPQTLPDTGILVGGCGRDEKRCSFCEVWFRPHEETGNKAIVDHESPGELVFRGCPWPTQRLINGIDAHTWRVLCSFIPQDKREEALKKLLEPSYERPAPSPQLPLRDAIDYLHWIILATIKFYKFGGGPPFCGGKVEIACVTSDRGFRWVTHKSLDWNVSDCEGQTEYSPVDPHRLGR